MRNSTVILLPISFLLILIISACGDRQNTIGNPDYLVHLDSLIAHSETFSNQKIDNIEDLLRKRQSAKTIEDRYALASTLYDQYSTFNSDSALKYADLSIELARLTGRQDWEVQSIIKKSEFLTGTGMLATAHDVINTIRPEEVPRQLLPQYYGQMIYLYSHLGNYAGGDDNRYYAMERAYKDSIMEAIDETHPEYLWYKGWDILGTDKPSKPTIDALRAKLEQSSLNTPEDAKNAFILALLYKQHDDRDNYLRALAMSAEADVRMANYKEMSSLEELSRAIYDNGNGDIDRAYSYMDYCLNKAISYPNRVKAYLLSESMNEVNQAYQQRERDQQRRVTLFLILTSILAAILLLSLLFNLLLNRKLRRQGRSLDVTNKTLSKNIAELNETQKALNEANTRLQSLITDLKSKNEELNEANYVKEEYICNIFTICSGYINQMAEFKKNIHLKALTKKYQEIANDTEDFDMKAEFREFYRSFDQVFLHIYPDFVNDFNELLQPDKRIYPKEGELLNTELRIYALIRLGITDSVKIAEFLHCSAQTIYNNRFRVRNRAIIPKKDFADTVRRLGTASLR